MPPRRRWLARSSGRAPSGAGSRCELGFDLAFAVAAGRIAANDATDAGGGRIDPGVVERGPRAPLTPEKPGRDLRPPVQTVADGAWWGRAEVAPEAATHVVHVGGSSRLGPIRRDMAEPVPRA